jgi:hypothetical protein
MGKQQAARASGRHPAATHESSANLRDHAASLAVPRGELPGWFWGLLGCLSVLGVGFTVLFFIVEPPGGPSALPSTAAATSAPLDPPASGPQIVPMTPPPASPAAALARPRPRPHAFRIAHAAGAPRAAPSAGGETDQAMDDQPTADDADDAPAPVAAKAAPVAAKTTAPAPKALAAAAKAPVAEMQASDVTPNVAAATPGALGGDPKPSVSAKASPRPLASAGRVAVSPAKLPAAQAGKDDGKDDDQPAAARKPPASPDSKSNDKLDGTEL